MCESERHSPSTLSTWWKQRTPLSTFIGGSSAEDASGIKAKNNTWVILDWTADTMDDATALSFSWEAPLKREEAERRESIMLTGEDIQYWWYFLNCLRLDRHLEQGKKRRERPAKTSTWSHNSQTQSSVWWRALNRAEIAGLKFNFLVLSKAVNLSTV